MSTKQAQRIKTLKTVLNKFIAKKADKTMTADGGKFSFSSLGLSNKISMVDVYSLGKIKSKISSIDLR